MVRRQRRDVKSLEAEREDFHRRRSRWTGLEMSISEGTAKVEQFGEQEVGRGGDDLEVCRGGVVDILERGR